MHNICYLPCKHSSSISVQWRRHCESWYPQSTIQSKKPPSHDSMQIVAWWRFGSPQDSFKNRSDNSSLLKASFSASAALAANSNSDLMTGKVTEYFSYAGWRDYNDIGRARSSHDSQFLSVDPVGENSDDLSGS